MIKTKLLTLTILSFIFFVHTISVSCTRSRVQADPTGSLSKSLTHNSLHRDYHLYIPSSYRDSSAAPLVIALHGGGGDGHKMEKLSHLSLLADRFGFIVAYPDAVEGHWNDGRGLNRYRSQKDNIDDVGFISGMIDAIAGEYNTNQDRVYVTGASNGAMMSLRLGCELAHKITALAPVIGYDAAAAVAKEAWESGRTVREVCLERGVLPEAELERLLDPRRQTEPG